MENPYLVFIVMIKEKCTYAEALEIVKNSKSKYVDNLSCLSKDELTHEVENSLKTQCIRSNTSHKIAHYRNNIYMFECHCCGDNHAH